MVHIIFIYARVGKLSMIPVWVFLRIESAGLPFHLANDSVDGFLYKNHDKPQV